MKKGGFIAETESGKIFDDVNLEEDWVEFDDKTNQSVGIYNLKTKFERLK